MREYRICAIANGSFPSMSGVFAGCGAWAPRFTRETEGTRSTCAEPQLGQHTSRRSFWVANVLELFERTGLPSGARDWLFENLALLIQWRPRGAGASRTLARTSPARVVFHAGGLERRDQAHVGRVVQAGDEATAHAAGGAGDDDVRHGDARARAVTSRGRTS